MTDVEKFNAETNSLANHLLTAFIDYTVANSVDAYSGLGAASLLVGEVIKQTGTPEGVDARLEEVIRITKDFLNAPDKEKYA
jgi:hypothetical protein